ncbi:MAG: DUF4124 domain-containing protein [Vicinamibacteria bacterium]|jgi:hypothetical protein
MHAAATSLAVGVIAALVALDAAGQVNRCVDKTGKVTYQQQPCEGAAPPARAPSAAPGPAPQGTPRKLTDEELELASLARILGTTRWCQEKVARYREFNAPNYDAWRRNNATAIRHVESDAGYRARMDRAYRDMDERFTAEDPAGRNRCVPWAGMAIAGVDPRAPRGPPPRYDAAPAASAKPRMSPEDESAHNLATLVAHHEWCEKNVPGMREQYGSHVAQWQREHAAALARIASSAMYRRQLGEYRIQLIDTGDPDDRQQVALCVTLTPMLLQSKP